jgi:hypothetical protein
MMRRICMAALGSATLMILSAQLANARPRGRAMPGLKDPFIAAQLPIPELKNPFTSAHASTTGVDQLPTPVLKNPFADNN